MSDFRVRPRMLDDIAAIPDLLRRACPGARDAASGERNLLRHLAHFAAGQFVAESEDGTVIGTAICMRLDLSRALAPHTWGEITGDGSLSTHVPGGEAMYGVHLAVDPAWRGRGVGRALQAARLGLARRLGCKAFVTGHPLGSGETEAGNRLDPALTQQMAKGFEMKAFLRDYAPEPGAPGHAALIVLWL